MSKTFSQARSNLNAPSQRRGNAEIPRAAAVGAPIEASTPPGFSRQNPRGRRGEHLPTLALSAFWFWIVMLILLCGCGVILVTMTPIFPKETAGPPRALATEPALTPTPRVQPTATSAATATPATVTAKITEDVVNLRARPTTSATILGKLQKDDQLTLIGRNQDSTWYQTESNNQKGWVFGQTLQIVSGDANALPVVQ